MKATGFSRTSKQPVNTTVRKGMEVVIRPSMSQEREIPKSREVLTRDTSKDRAPIPQDMPQTTLEATVPCTKTPISSRGKEVSLGQVEKNLILEGPVMLRGGEVQVQVIRSENEKNNGQNSCNIRIVETDNTGRAGQQEGQNMEFTIALVNIPIQDASSRGALQEIGINASVLPMETKEGKHGARWKRNTGKENKRIIDDHLTGLGTTAGMKRNWRLVYESDDDEQHAELERYKKIKFN